MGTDLFVCYVLFEWWIGKQKWINAKSGLALLLLIVTLLWLFITKPLRKEN